ncbi:hypothetical protein [Pigmentiphaga litoralis]|uniref:DNA-binding transcriptional LysR family regulator n=1 Tax=Pigmentiphaga litoralis TaxID=516702 RepID=A0A7Y9IQF4_9BURK|nr:hypothetical protein [Pigmentiphaga litoralis]NYE25288.1 DNA-binding transcriptional LysR family regulator [Pigmentiphaga litoralis]NYE81099.1 DNA-binding transcriptional LysR family regulator [Pigmentiphaga litoralis]
MIKGRRSTTLTVEPVLRLTSRSMARDTVRAGAGVARLPISLVGN